MEANCGPRAAMEESCKGILAEDGCSADVCSTKPEKGGSGGLPTWLVVVFGIGGAAIFASLLAYAYTKSRMSSRGDSTQLSDDALPSGYAQLRD